MGRAKQQMMDAEAEEQVIVEMLVSEGAAERCENHDDYAIDQEDFEAEERVAASYASDKDVSIEDAAALVQRAKMNHVYDECPGCSHNRDHG